MLSVLALGHLTFEQISPLQTLFPSLELIDSTLARDAALAEHGAEINRALAAASNPWVLILREGEVVDAALAGEIARAIAEPAQAWGLRIRAQPMYVGKPLLLTTGDAGEIRLVHQRHARFDRRSAGGGIKVDGTVVRLQNPLRRVTFATSQEHTEFLRSRGVPHSLGRRILLFTRNAIVTGAWYRSRSTLRYLWLEAGYDLEGNR